MPEEFNRVQDTYLARRQGGRRRRPAAATSRSCRRTGWRTSGWATRPPAPGPRAAGGRSTCPPPGESLADQLTKLQPRLNAITTDADAASAKGVDSSVPARRAATATRSRSLCHYVIERMGAPFWRYVALTAVIDGDQAPKTKDAVAAAVASWVKTSNLAGGRAAGPALRGASRRATCSSPSSTTPRGPRSSRPGRAWPRSFRRPPPRAGRRRRRPWPARRRGPRRAAAPRRRGARRRAGRRPGRAAVRKSYDARTAGAFDPYVGGLRAILDRPARQGAAGPQSGVQVGDWKAFKAGLPADAAPVNASLTALGDRGRPPPWTRWRPIAPPRRRGPLEARPRTICGWPRRWSRNDQFKGRAAPRCARGATWTPTRPRRRRTCLLQGQGGARSPPSTWSRRTRDRRRRRATTGRPSPPGVRRPVQGQRRAGSRDLVGVGPPEVRPLPHRPARQAQAAGARVRGAPCTAGSAADLTLADVEQARADLATLGASSPAFPTSPATDEEKKLDRAFWAQVPAPRPAEAGRRRPAVAGPRRARCSAALPSAAVPKSCTIRTLSGTSRRPTAEGRASPRSRWAIDLLNLVRVGNRAVFEDTYPTNDGAAVKLASREVSDQPEVGDRLRVQRPPPPPPRCPPLSRRGRGRPSACCTRGVPCPPTRPASSGASKWCSRTSHAGDQQCSAWFELEFADPIPVAR